jgi:hypothetical protein
MSVPTRTPASAPPAPAVPARARALAARLAGLFEKDQQIVLRLTDAHRRLAASTDRLWTDPAADPLRVHQEIHSAFWAYQQASEERRQLAVDVGELSAQLVETLAAAGWTEEAARRANVHELAMAGAR